MKTSETITKIAAAISKAQSKFKDVAKSGENAYDRYKYAQLEDYRDAVVAGLGECELAVITTVDNVIPCEPRTTKNGGVEQVVRVHLTQRIIHSSGEWIETECFGEGQDRSDKAIYKAITGARKYAMCSALNLATSDDPEGDEDKQPPAPTKPKAQAQKPPAQEKPKTPPPAAGTAAPSSQTSNQAQAKKEESAVPPAQTEKKLRFYVCHKCRKVSSADMQMVTCACGSNQIEEVPTFKDGKALAEKLAQTPPTEAAAPAQTSTEPKVDHAILRRINGYMGTLGLTTLEEKKDLAEMIVGHPLVVASDMTAAEGATVVTKLEQMIANSQNQQEAA